MTGPEHYLEAERLLADRLNLSGRYEGVVSREVAAHAQVHATLALAAATALAAESLDSRAWRDAAGTKLSGGAS
jgi:hypothetical protein